MKIDDDAPQPRITVQPLDEILGRKFDVLDAGFVRVVDYMGGDASIVQAARVSYGAGTKQLQEDQNLIRYLLRQRHTTPFEMCEIKLHVRVPMDCWRQWIRHRTANVNEYSTRYSVAIDLAQQTTADSWRSQESDNRQGSGKLISVAEGERFSQGERELQAHARAVYEERIKSGVAREQARKDLPLSTYTEAYWKTDLHNMLHFLRLRMDRHAQFEIRQYANIIGNKIVARWCPTAWQAFLDYQIETLSFSRHERRILVSLIRGDRDRATELATDAGWLNAEGTAIKRNRERVEFEAKLLELGLTAPWL